jgi:hypothetical protein
MIRGAARLAVLVAVAVLLGGCATNLSRFYKREARPGRTKLTARLVHVPARLVGNHFIVEARWNKHGPWRFLVDTGSSVTLVSPEFSRRYATAQAPSNTPTVRVRSADGKSTVLPSVTVRQIQLGEDAHFYDVPVLVYDFAELSAHLGMKIDGVIGFSLFRDVVFALDYPQSRLVITTAGEKPLLPGTTIPFNNQQRTPLIPIKLGEESFIALIDSGSDGPLLLNPVGLHPHFKTGPRAGGTVGTLTGNRTQQIGRLDQPLELGSYALAEPVVDLTDQLSAIGGEILRHFCVTFDPPRNQVTFHRDSTAPIPPEPRRISGLSFSKTPAYWRVVSVVPGSPAHAAGIRAGHLVTRIEGEPVSAWALPRYEAHVRRASTITFTFLDGAQEFAHVVPIFELVP